MGLLIGIGGVSRSGKTELTKYLFQNLPRAEIVHQDSFVKSEKNIPIIQGRVDWEHPDSIDWKKLHTYISRSLETHSYTILEGLFAFHNLDLENLMRLKIQLTLDKDQFLHRKKLDERWQDEPDWFIDHIWNSHLLFGLPHTEDLLMQVHQITNASYQSILHSIQNLKG